MAKQGTTTTIKLTLDNSIDVTKVSSIIYTFRTAYNKVIKKYPSDDIEYKNGKFLIRLTQEDTNILVGDTKIEGQINFIDKSVAKTEITEIRFDFSLNTTFIKGNVSNDEDLEEISLNVDDDVIYVSGDNYNSLVNKPKINSVELVGNVSLATLGVDTYVGEYIDEHKEELKGDKGDTGATGATGAKGDKGDKGDTGPQGPKGETGETGPKGADGANGINGTNGIDGKDGKDGKDGVSPTVTTSKSGKTTTITITDVNGAHTSTILDGVDGKDGKDGKDGTTAEVATETTNGLMSSTDKSKLDGIEDNATCVTEQTVIDWGFSKGGGGGTGSVNAITVNDSRYNPDGSGVIALPDYPTTLPASDVSEWAKADTKPTYTASEVGALPDTTEIPDEDTVTGWGFTKNTGDYSKPADGIPKTDLASAVQTSLGKADTALQSYTETDPVFSASAASGITSDDITAWNSKQSALTEAQLSATNSGITKEKVDAIPNSYAPTDAQANVIETIKVNNVALTPTNKSVNITVPDAVTESTVSGWGFTKNTGTYSKPSGGIPKTDLSSDVQTSLGKADTALQSETYKGTVTSVKVGTTSYNPASGVVSLPAYPSVPTFTLNGTTLTITT